MMLTFIIKITDHQICDKFCFQPFFSEVTVPTIYRRTEIYPAYASLVTIMYVHYYGTISTPSNFFSKGKDCS